MPSAIPPTNQSNAMRTYLREGSVVAAVSEVSSCMSVIADCKSVLWSLRRLSIRVVIENSETANVKISTVPELRLLACF